MTEEKHTLAFGLEPYLKERNEAFASLDEDKLRTHFANNDMVDPFTGGSMSEMDSTVFWGAIHKARCYLPDHVISPEEKAKSAQWLTEHNLRVPQR